MKNENDNTAEENIRVMRVGSRMDKSCHENPTSRATQKRVSEIEPCFVMRGEKFDATDAIFLMIP